MASNKDWLRLIGAAALGLSAAGLSGCDDVDNTPNSAEDVGESIDDAADNAADNIEDAADDMGDAVDDVGDRQPG